MGSFKKDCQCIVLKNRRLTDRLYLMTLRSEWLAEQTAPGQFIHMEVPTLQANILRRPFSVYDTFPREGTIDVLYQVVGEGTEDMSKWQAGYLTKAIGPIGHEWSPPEQTEKALLVGGGVGGAPLLMLYKELLKSGVETDVVLGAADAESLVCRDRYKVIDLVEPRCSTDDGSYGRKGFATVLAEEALAEAQESGRQYDYVAVCGPEPLMRAVSRLTAERGIVTEVSMERRMACGIGACLSCVVETVNGKKRACVDGPVFNAEKIAW